MTTRSRLFTALARAARRKGYELLPTWRLDSHVLARHLEKVFAMHRIDCVLDVGGNLGQYRDLLREQVGFEGLIVTFEPVAKYVDILRERARGDARWRIMDFALAAADGSAPINVTHSPGLNSFLQPRIDAQFDYWPADPVSGQETVRLRTLDGVFDELSRECVMARPYLKMDTQGFDLEVVRGASRTLPHVRALQTEASIKALYEGMPGYQTTIDRLTALGFELSGLFPVSHGENLDLIEFDCVMVNRAHAA